MCFVATKALFGFNNQIIYLFLIWMHLDYLPGVICCVISYNYFNIIITVAHIFTEKKTVSKFYLFKTFKRFRCLIGINGMETNYNQNLLIERFGLHQPFNHQVISSVFSHLISSIPVSHNVLIILRLMSSDGLTMSVYVVMVLVLAVFLWLQSILIASFFLSKVTR